MNAASTAPLCAASKKTIVPEKPKIGSTTASKPKGITMTTHRAARNTSIVLEFQGLQNILV